MNQPSASFCLIVAGLVPAMPGFLVQGRSAPFERDIRPLIEAHCVDCHGPDTQKAGLRLDDLKAALDDPRAMDLWTRVHDKIDSGEMPPENRDRPPAADLDRAKRALRDSLHTASLERQQTQGRVLIRRLNGTEYENTVRELVGTQVRLRELLPEDGAVAGFDNVSAALDLSSTHLLLYQEAAEKAVASAIPAHPPIPFQDRRTGRVMSEKGSNFQQTLNRSCKLEGDALVIYSKLPRYGLACTANVPGRGRYRVRLLAAAVGAAKQPVAAAFCTVDRGREPPVVKELVDFQPGEPQVIETEIDLEANEAFVVNLLVNWDIRATKQPIEAHDGPGILIEWMEIEGPIDPFPSRAYRSLFGEAPLKPKSVVKAEREGRAPPKIAENRVIQHWLMDPLEPVSDQAREESERLIRAFMPRAFRRPVSEELQGHYVGMVHAKLEAGDSFLDAMTYGYKAILTSPHFLFFIEPGPGARTEEDRLASVELDGPALANRLSYFLWSGPPDDALMKAAESGALSRPDELRRQTERLLGSPMARRFTENFTGQWLDLRKMDATIPDPHLYGDFDGTLLWSMPLETHLFFEEVLKKDLSLLEFVDSDWTMVNARLAAHYGLPGVVGNDFRRVSLPPDSHRGGVMTHASVLKVTADGTHTSPILRGKWVLERIIGRHPSPPPPDVAAIEPDIRGATTIRQQLDKHRSVASCNSCHQHIDPPGFALETFDPIGGFREFYRATSRTPGGIVSLPDYTGRAFYRGPDVEKGGQTHDGRKFETIEDYKAILLEDPDQICRNLTAKLLTYATGADVQFADREIVEQIVATLRTKNFGFRTLVHEVVQSRAFRNK
jgi:hypothetical protein